MIGCERVSGQRGQSSVEMLGALPALLLIAVVVMQLLAVGYTAVLAGNAAEAGALAMAAGRGAEQAARAGAPGWARGRMSVRRASGAVHVQMQPPKLLPFASGWMRVSATAAVAAPGRIGLGG